MEKVFIYIDEFGTSALSQNDQKNITHFIYSAVVIKESQKGKAHWVRNEISKKFFKGNTIKSSSKLIRKNDSLRLDALKSLVEDSQFIFSLLIVNKTELDKDKGGLRFKEVFYKFFQKILITKMNENFSDFQIVMDKTITDEYMAGVRTYLAENVHNSLFDSYTFKTDEDEPLIQFADLIVGSIGKIFNSDYKTGIEGQIFDILRPKLTDMYFFPYESANDYLTQIEADDSITERIYEIVHSDGKRIVDELSDKTQIIALEQLLWQHHFLPTKYIKSHDLVNSVSLKFGKEISMSDLRIIIRELRYRGIIIVSHPSYGGYKLAINENDISLYFTHFLKFIVPMLDKVEIANNIFKNKTGGDFIPLENIKVLQSLVDTYIKGKTVKK